MVMKVRFNPQALEAAINQIGTHAVKGMSMKMRRTAIRIRDLAREYAPVKTGDLERAIDYAHIKDGRRDAFVVFVNVDAARSGQTQDGLPKDGQVGEYAWIMEEELHPYGRQKGARRFTLGPKSQDKADSGKKVGGRFLARAIRVGTEQLLADMVAEVRRVTGGPRVGPTRYERPDYNSESEE